MTTGAIIVRGQEGYKSHFIKHKQDKKPSCKQEGFFNDSLTMLTYQTTNNNNNNNCLFPRGS